MTRVDHAKVALRSVKAVYALEFSNQRSAAWFGPADGRCGGVQRRTGFLHCRSKVHAQAGSID